MILCNLTDEDRPKQSILIQKLNALGHYNIKVTYQELNFDLIEKAKLLGAESIILSNPLTLKHLVASTSKGNHEDWRGATITYSVPILVIGPLAHVHTVKYGEFLLDTDLAKLEHINKPKPKYAFTLCNDYASLDEAAAELNGADCLVIDIETTRQNTISNIAYTPITNYKIGMTYQINLQHDDHELNVAGWRTLKFLNECPAAKAFHNGAFDVFQLLRFQSPVYNYILDTEYIMHAWYAELRKSLNFCTSIFVPEYYFWKEEAESNPREYNAKDTINTAKVLIAMMQQAPNWVWTNYSKTLPNVIPNIYAAFEGFKVDEELKASLKDEAEEAIIKARTSLQKMAGTESFNPASPQQASFVLYKLFGAVRPPRTKGVTGTDEVTLKKLQLVHPLLARFIDQLLIFRKESKAFSTYYGAELRNGRLLYSLGVDGTETGRMSSTKSSLYAPLPSGRRATKSNERNYGAQLQNQPPYMKKALIADDGFTLGNVDKSQSEARCVAVLAQDKQLYSDLYREPTLIEVKQYDGDYSAAGDFYCRCTYRYFGMVINKKNPARQITKKINHGTSYMMQEETFIDSVSIPKMMEAKKILNRPSTEALPTFARHLLSLFHGNYKDVMPWWKSIKVFIAKNGYYDTPDGWRRIFFGNILKNHAIWRSAVAHAPQHFSVAGINTAIYRLWYLVQTKSNGEYRYKGQVHDSIIFQAKTEKFDHYMAKTLEIMDIPQYVREGVELRIPLDAESGQSWKGMTPWENGQ